MCITEADMDTAPEGIENTMTYEEWWDAVSYTHLTLPTTLHECRSRWSRYH